MSRYRVEPCKVSKTFNIYGPGGQVLGYIYGPWKPESERLKRFIEAHDEIVEALHAASDDSLCRRQSAETVTQIVTLLNRIDGKEAQ